jgi:hypothetical protein
MVQYLRPLLLVQHLQQLNQIDQILHLKLLRRNVDVHLVRLQLNPVLFPSLHLPQHLYVDIDVGMERRGLKTHYLLYKLFLSLHRLLIKTILKSHPRLAVLPVRLVQLELPRFFRTLQPILQRRQVVVVTPLLLPVQPVLEILQTLFLPPLLNHEVEFKDNIAA